LALDPQDQGPQDHCGVFGVWAPGEDVAKLTYFGLYALQHRGQESAGIAVSNGRQCLGASKAFACPLDEIFALLCLDGRCANGGLREGT
jgi:glutamate synthase domain-containing protein 1